MIDTISFDIVPSDRGVTVVRVHGAVYAENRDALLTALLELAEAGPARIVVDVAAVPLCDSSALNMLVQAHRHATARGGWLRLAAPQPAVERILRVTNLHLIMPIHPDSAAAGHDA